MNDAHQFEAVGGDFPDTCRICACFKDSANHSSTVSRLNSPSTCNDSDRKQTTSEISSESQSSPNGGFDAPIRTDNLDREVCEFLGIPPRREWCVGRESERSIRIYFGSEEYTRKWLAEKQADGLHLDQEVWPLDVYPAVSTTWEGFGLMVAALKKKDWYVGCSVNSAGRDIATIVTKQSGRSDESADTIPLALALAVQVFAKAGK